jgi:hypothetical protein
MLVFLGMATVVFIVVQNRRFQLKRTYSTALAAHGCCFGLGRQVNCITHESPPLPPIFQPPLSKKKGAFCKAYPFVRYGWDF